MKISREEIYENGEKYFLRHLSIDCVIFGFHEGKLKVLLLELKETGEWCLPGGFIQYEESLEEASSRVVNERTGLKDIYLRQFYTFGKLTRQRGKDSTKIPKGLKANSWLMERFVTIGYWALVEYSKVTPVPDPFSSTCMWEDVDRVRKLILDHNEILEIALQSLRLSLNEYPIGKDLLPQKFTIPELQQLYETVLNKKLDRRNFQKRILSLRILKKLNEKKKGVAHRAPTLYVFDNKQYQQALKQGLKFGF
jgi:8-oxo-dGTP diphosphatase